MIELVTPVLLSVISSMTAVVTSVGLSRPARIRHELKEISQTISGMDHSSTAYKALARVADIRSAELAAIRLVRHDSFLLGASAVLVFGGVSAVVLGGQFAPAVASGWIAAALGYCVLFTHVPDVGRLRRRQARAMLAGRPSGFFVITMGIPLRRETVRRDIYHPEEYPLLPWALRQIERARGRRSSLARVGRSRQTTPVLLEVGDRLR